MILAFIFQLQYNEGVYSIRHKIAERVNSMEAFEQLIFDLKALSINKSEQGTRFEKLMKQFLLVQCG